MDITEHSNRFLFKQPTRRTNYPNLFCYKTLRVSGIFSAHHQEFSTVQSALVSFMQVFDDRFQGESGWNQCRMYSRKLLMMGREDVQNMQNFITEYIWIIGASGWLFQKKAVYIFVPNIPNIIFDNTLTSILRRTQVAVDSFFIF